MSELVLLKYRLLAFKNYIKDTITNSPLRFFFSLAFFVVIFIVIYDFFKATYSFFAGFEDLKFDLWFSNTILNGIFFFNFIFITVSATILAYNIIYKDKNTLLLYFSRVSRRAIFCEVFIRTSLISSWSFLVLSVPLLLVQFEQYRISFFSSYMLISALLVVFFLFLPNAIGVCIGLFLPVFFTTKEIIKFLLFLLVIASFGLLPYLGVFGSGWSSIYSDIWIAQTLKKFAFLEHPLLPTYWISSSLNGFFHSTFKEDSVYLLITTSLIVVVWVFIIFSAFFKNMLILSARYISQKNPIIEAIIGLCKKIMGAINVDTRYLFLKDIVIFLRDGRFWGQLLLFIGIFVLYFMNLSESEIEGAKWVWGQQIKWKELILHLNIIASAFMASALAGRGLFPQFSIEYSKLWITQFGKHPLRKIVHYKLITIGMLVIAICVATVSASSIILKINKTNIAYAIAHCIIFTYTISNMALKLGVLFHHKRSDNPVIVFSGPGGIIYIMFGILYITLNAVLMLKIGLFGHKKVLWIIIFICENILINAILNKASNKVCAGIEYI